MLYTKDRQAIVKEATQWLLTPYRGWSRLKGLGADCIGFVAGVYIRTKHITEQEADEAIPPDYSLQIGQHQEDTEYIEGIKKFMREIPLHEVRPGDVAMFKMALAYSHSAIVVNYPLILHSLAHGGVRYADAIRQPMLAGKPVRFFTLQDGR